MATIAAVAGALLGAPALAQDPAGLLPGERVRVASEGQILVGRLVTIDEETITVASSRRPAGTSIPLSRIARVQRGAGRHGHWGAGALVGGGLGLALGLVGSVRSSGDEVPEWYLDDTDRVAFTGLFAAVGAVGGGLLGAAIRTEEWEDVPLEHAVMLGRAGVPAGEFVVLQVPF